MQQRSLRIAQIGSIWETTPPKLYGGTERVVSCLTEGLVKQGHEVTLFATGDSKTAAKLESIVDEPLYRNKIFWANLPYPLMHIYHAYEHSDRFDILHMHLNLPSDFIALAFTKLTKIPTVFTLHFRQPTENGGFDQDIYKVLRKFQDCNFISISDSQRKIKQLNYVSTVYNGIPVDDYDFNPKGGLYLSWLGRFKTDKGPKEAIEVALSTKMQLIMAGKIDTQDKIDQAFYKESIEPDLRKHQKLLKYIGEVDDKKKNVFLGSSRCLINPIKWDEPFGLVVAEANACGTPVVAFARGSMPEIIKNGVNGFLVEPDDVKGMAAQVKKISSMEEQEYQELRKSSREHVEKNFSANKMASDYEQVYFKVVNK